MNKRQTPGLKAEIIANIVSQILFLYKTNSFCLFLLNFLSFSVKINYFCLSMGSLVVSGYLYHHTECSKSLPFVF